MTSKIKTLIVEDDPMVAEITKEFIKDDSDFEVIGVAPLGQTAIDIIADKKPELVLLDYCLPDFNGTEVIKKTRSFDENVEFIVITAAREVPLVQECFRLGIRDYLIKPFLKQRFIQALHSYKSFKDALANKDVVSQADLDRLKNNKITEETTPKGFSQLTEEKIIEIINQHAAEGITAEEVAAEIGITPVSARRYLKLLQDKQLIDYDLIYGKQGRPTYLFKPL